jgi:hypothetical protein
MPFNLGNDWLVRLSQIAYPTLQQTAAMMQGSNYESFLVGKLRLSRHLTSPDILMVKVQPIQVFPIQ